MRFFNTHIFEYGWPDRILVKLSPVPFCAPFPGTAVFNRTTELACTYAYVQGPAGAPPENIEARYEQSRDYLKPVFDAQSRHVHRNNTEKERSEASSSELN